MMTMEAQSDQLVQTTVRCTEVSFVSFASIACQVRKQDAYYVLQGLGVETRDTAWVWLKVKYL